MFVLYLLFFFYQVSYNAAGVLAHMASDGPEAWTIEDPSRTDVLTRMKVAIERWNLRAERNINYRSFEPILRLIKVTHTPECQHWAVWALANLTSVDCKSKL
jgi:Zyg-11 family protein